MGRRRDAHLREMQVRDRRSREGKAPMSEEDKLTEGGVRAQLGWADANKDSDGYNTMVPFPHLVLLSKGWLALTEERDRLRAALELIQSEDWWCGECDNWVPYDEDWHVGSDSECPFCNSLLTFHFDLLKRGEIARQALAGQPEEEGE